jgi:hypothetical protein
MAKKIPEKFQVWIDARKKFHLSNAHIQMAREIGMNPKKFGKLNNHNQEKWKAPLPEFIEKIYHKHFGKTRPDVVKSIEQMIKEANRKKEQRKLKKAKRKSTKENTCQGTI